MTGRKSDRIFDPERVDDDSPELGAEFFRRARPGMLVDPELATVSRRRRTVRQGVRSGSDGADPER
jgi:hypothetical protein